MPFGIEGFEDAVPVGFYSAAGIGNVVSCPRRAMLDGVVIVTVEGTPKAGSFLVFDKLPQPPKSRIPLL
jgi:hypothetical protein